VVLEINNPAVGIHDYKIWRVQNQVIGQATVLNFLLAN